jgi:hypothetical protein
MQTRQPPSLARIAIPIVIIALAAGACAFAGPGQMPGNIYPQGTQLLFSAYTLQEAELSRAKDSGFTAIGPYYGRDKSAFLRYAHKAGLPLIYSVGPKVDFDDSAFEAEVLLQEIAAEVRDIVQKDTVAIWNVRNEELRHWNPAEMDWLERITRVIRENDPLKRPIMMYEPNHRRSDQLVLTGQYLDIVAKGSYSNYVGMKHKRTWLRWSMEQSLEASAQTGNVPIAILWMRGDQKSAADIAAIPYWVRHDVYLSLISGAKGIIVYSAWNRRPGFKQHFSLFFDAYAATAAELNGPLQLAQVFLFGDERSDIQVRQTNGPKLQKFIYRRTEFEYPVIHAKQLAYAGFNYLFVVNSANEPVRVSLDGLPAGSAASDAFNAQLLELETEIELAALEVRAIRWQ